MCHPAAIGQRWAKLSTSSPRKPLPSTPRHHPPSSPSCPLVSLPPGSRPHPPAACSARYWVPTAGSCPTKPPQLTTCTTAAPTGSSSPGGQGRQLMVAGCRVLGEQLQQLQAPCHLKCSQGVRVKAARSRMRRAVWVCMCGDGVQRCSSFKQQENSRQVGVKSCGGAGCRCVSSFPCCRPV
jgi:hypothetical protein